ncbi:hypothetical protein ACFW1A_20955 [Kitasatospora sp. NPDC058965]|uniref:hypothetical protein n=1 Tax=Kitasatospora sp. NPDC058965 TaxID=3346682 RepID=UPI00368EE322
MASLPRRAAAVILAAAGLLGLAGAATEASATTIQHFRSSGSYYYASQRAWAAAFAAGYTADQCGAESDGVGGYWTVVVTCTR